MLLKRAQSEPRNVYEELDLLGFDPTLDGPGGGSRVGQWALQNCWLDFRPVQRSVTVLTWATWCTESWLEHLRAPEIVSTVLSGEHNFDVVALQEVSFRLHNLFRAHPQVRAHWHMTDFVGFMENSKASLGGGLVLVRRSFAHQFSHIKTAVAGTAGKPDSMQIALEFWRDEKVKLRLVASSFPRQEGCSPDLQLASTLLGQSMLSNPFVGGQNDGRDRVPGHTAIGLGSFDLSSYSELAPLLERGFVDVGAALRPYRSEEAFDKKPLHALLEELLYEEPTFPVHYKSEKEQKRADLIFVKGGRHHHERHLMRALDAGHVGRRPMAQKQQGHRLDEEKEDGRVFDRRSKDGHVYPSNHLGVYSVIEMSE